MTAAVLFVCLGNICRSPTAEAVFAARSFDMDVTHDSAGTSDWHIGHPPYGPMIRAADARSIAMDHLRARQFVATDFDDFDLIIGMDAQNIQTIEALRPPGSTTAVKLLLEYGQGPETDVPDPYYTRDFGGALDLIEHGIDGLIEALGR